MNFLEYLINQQKNQWLWYQVDKKKRRKEERKKRRKEEKKNEQGKRRREKETRSINKRTNGFSFLFVFLCSFFCLIFSYFFFFLAWLEPVRPPNTVCEQIRRSKLLIERQYNFSLLPSGLKKKKQKRKRKEKRKQKKSSKIRKGSYWSNDSTTFHFFPQVDQKEKKKREQKTKDKKWKVKGQEKRKKRKEKNRRSKLLI